MKKWSSSYARRSREHGTLHPDPRDAEFVTAWALDHIGKITRKCTRHAAFYGCVYPLAQRDRATRVMCRIHARRITLDAIHG